MWEALMLLRLIACAGPTFSVARRATPPALPADTLKGAIRLSFAAYRLSLPVSRPPDGIMTAGSHTSYPAVGTGRPRDYIALNKALGGGWDGAIDTTNPEIVDASTGPRLASTTE
ncbi:hypothetical protein [Mesorhizobium sp. B2-4-14]|uniref:hypothetical protein n=1 Tax=Mesorhizobium sp. B2-4-14 TaxID=2589935 RepID=UPI0015E41883|nr:hypothetical protein [Mesorhizobium sp. B2-4-14]